MDEEGGGEKKKLHVCGRRGRTHEIELGRFVGPREEKKREKGGGKKWEWEKKTGNC